MLTRMNYTGAGGSAPKWLTGSDITVSGTTISCQWDYEADTVIALYTGSRVFIVMFDRTGTLWLSNDANGWQNAGVASGITWGQDGKSFTFNTGQNLSNVSVLPIQGKPTGYFS